MTIARLGGRKFTGLVLCVAAVTYLAHLTADGGAIAAIGGMYLTYCGGNTLIEKFHAGKAGCNADGTVARTEPGRG